MTRPTPFKIAATDADLADLNLRLDRARLPEAETVDDWSQGAPLAYMRRVRDHWRNDYDWRAREAALNQLDQFRATADGFGLHFVHMRSPHPNAAPLLLSHGWPGSIVEFAKAIPRLLDPPAYGGDAADAFHVVAPSLPGFGYSDKPTKPGYGVQNIAKLFDRLMRDLGYDRYFAQGGDWGSMITTLIGAQNQGACQAIHVNMPIGRPNKAEMANPTPEDAVGIAALKAYQDWDSGYSKQQSTRPQTVGYGLVDSPIGLAGWIIEKFWRWTDCDGDPENALSLDEMLDDIMLYWLPATGAASARIYWESFGKPILKETGPATLPAGCSLFPKEIFRPPRAWAERTYANIVHWNVLDKGGHFAAFEQPESFVDEVSACFRGVR